MRLEVLADAEEAACGAASAIAASARSAVAARGRCILSFSGGRSPTRMLRELVEQPIPWPAAQIVQVDERVAPLGHADRNLTLLLDSLVHRAPIDPAHVHPMPVDSPDLEAAATQYAALLESIAGTPPILDVVHLGIGTDGHTASLTPGDPICDLSDRDVALSRVYEGRRRMTLTLPVLNRSRCLVWLVTGAEKAAVLSRLLAGDATIPAGRVRRDRAVVFADRAAAGSRGTGEVETADSAGRILGP